MEKLDKKAFIAEVKENVKSLYRKNIWRRLPSSRFSRQCPMR